MVHCIGFTYITCFGTNNYCQFNFPIRFFAVFRKYNIVEWSDNSGACLKKKYGFAGDFHTTFLGMFCVIQPHTHDSTARLTALTRHGITCVACTAWYTSLGSNFEYILFGSLCTSETEEDTGFCAIGYTYTRTRRPGRHLVRLMLNQRSDEIQVSKQIAR